MTGAFVHIAVPVALSVAAPLLGCSGGATIASDAAGDARAAVDSAVVPGADAAGSQAPVEDGSELTPCVAQQFSAAELPTLNFAALSNTALVLDAEDRPHIFFHDPGGEDTPGRLLHAFRGDDSWWVQVVDSDGDVGATLSATRSADGQFHVLYYRRITNPSGYAGDLRHAFGSEQVGWTTATIDEPGNTGLLSSLTSAGDVVHAAYLRDGSPKDELVYAHRQGSGSWSTEVVGPMDYLGESTAIAVDDDGSIHILYYLDEVNEGAEPDQGTLHHASRSGTDPWVIETVDSRPSSGLYASAVAFGNTVHVSYFDYSDGGLRYGRRDPDGEWTASEIAADGGGHTAIAVDGDGLVHIVDLIYSDRYPRYRAGSLDGGWAVSPIDQTAESGWFSSVAVAADGTVHVSYVDFWNAQLRYSRRCP